VGVHVAAEVAEVDEVVWTVPEGGLEVVPLASRGRTEMVATETSRSQMHPASEEISYSRDQRTWDITN